jgi:hypothetical protein
VWGGVVTIPIKHTVGLVSKHNTQAAESALCVPGMANEKTTQRANMEVALTAQSGREESL